MEQIKIEQINKKIANYTPEEILRWAWENYGDSMTMTSSFQTQSVPLLYLVSQTIPEVPVLFLDTGFHFPETLAFRDELIEKYKLNVVNVKTEIGHQNFKMRYGKLYQLDPDLCCHINKTVPLQKKLQEYGAWVAGVRGDQTKERSEMKAFDILENGQIKICPILKWTKKDLWAFHSKNDLPMHPLFVKGYMSIGCAPCTKATTDPNDERSGRWADNCKTECGIHTGIGKKEDQSPQK